MLPFHQRVVLFKPLVCDNCKIERHRQLVVYRNGHNRSFGDLRNLSPAKALLAGLQIKCFRGTIKQTISC